jgi:hypothetical protein
MPTLAWPTLTRGNPAQLEMALRYNTVVFSSPLTRATQTVEFPGARWEVQFTLNNLTDPDTAILQAFLAQLRGQAGRFTLHDFSRPTPRGTATGTPLVMGAGQTGTTLTMDGLAAGATLLRGDKIGVNGELKMVVSDATANGSGVMAVTFEPPLRASPADNATVTLINPTATFRLTEDAMRTLTRAPRLSDITIDAVECWV